MDEWHAISLNIPFASSEHAEIARRVLQVDSELQPNLVRRTLITEGDSLVVSFSVRTVRLARLALNAFLENLDLVTRTLGEFSAEAANARTITAA